MKSIIATFGIVIIAALLSGSNAAALGENSRISYYRRALPNAPDGYTPANLSCPSNRPNVRSASKLSQNETDWLKQRRSNTALAMKDFFGHVKIDNFDAAAYVDKYKNDSTNLPNIGIAVSGGGYRALMNGAGALKAFDSRTPNSTAQGQLGGLLQSATYLSGLSGGGWLLSSIYINNFTTVKALQDDDTGSVWEFGRSIIEGPSKKGINLLNTLDYWKHLISEVSGKSDAGFNISITDYWGRALSYQMINQTSGGPAYTWSSISLMPDFQSGNMPLPMLLADGRNPGEKLVGGNATIFEFNPWEFGTFDPTIFGFIPVEFLGTKFDGGTVPQNGLCVRGFDNAGYIMGTSSSLFNQFALHLDKINGFPKSIKDDIEKILTKLGEDNDDIADYSPNPFLHYANNSSPFKDQKSLTVVDGGEDEQNVPLQPLIQPLRKVDVVFAIDSTADSNNWPNGSALVATYERSLNSSGIANHTVFPAIPDSNTFINKGLNTKPTFFGCDSKNLTGPSPLIVYIPNFPYVTYSNVSTFDLAYNNTQRDAIIMNGYNVATMANGTRDTNWPACVGCAMLSRSMERTNTTVPDICKSCFKTYCWDGSLNTTTPATYAPTIVGLQINLKSIAHNLFASRVLSVLTAVGASVFSLM